MHLIPLRHGEIERTLLLTMYAEHVMEEDMPIMSKSDRDYLIKDYNRV